MSREAEPLDPTALSAWHDACIEEIHQGYVNRGLSALLGTHTGFRKRIVVHYTDEWRIESAGGTDEKISLPEGQAACTIEDDGCKHCHNERYSGDDGFFRVKKNTCGAGREIPLWEEWMDYHREETRPTELPEWLDHYFKTEDSFGFTPPNFGHVVFAVAQRRHDTIANQHEGEVERWVQGAKKTVPDIRPHDLRATWATQCLRAGVETEQLMDWAGWESRTMVERYRKKLNDPSGANTSRYAKGRPEEGMSAADKIAKLKEMGMLSDDENLSAEKLATLETLLS